MSETAAESRFLTLGQVAEDLQLSRRTVERLVAAEILPAVRIGGSIRVERDELDGWISERRTAETTVGSGSSAELRSAVGRGSAVDDAGDVSRPRPAERRATAKPGLTARQLAGETKGET